MDNALSVAVVVRLSTVDFFESMAVIRCSFLVDSSDSKNENPKPRHFPEPSDPNLKHETQKGIKSGTFTHHKSIVTQFYIPPITAR